MNNPPSPLLLFSDAHHWVLLEGDCARIGLTDFAIEKKMGRILAITFAPRLQAVEQGVSYGVLDTSTNSFDLIAPVSARVEEKNPMATARPALIAADPFGQGWILRISQVGAGQLDALLGAEEYRRKTQERP